MGSILSDGEYGRHGESGQVGLASVSDFGGEGVDEGGRCGGPDCIGNAGEFAQEPLADLALGEPDGIEDARVADDLLVRQVLEGGVQFLVRLASCPELGADLLTCGEQESGGCGDEEA